MIFTSCYPIGNKEFPVGNEFFETLGDTGNSAAVIGSMEKPRLRSCFSKTPKHSGPRSASTNVSEVFTKIPKFGTPLHVPGRESLNADTGNFESANQSKYIADAPNVELLNRRSTFIPLASTTPQPELFSVSSQQSPGDASSGFAASRNHEEEEALPFVNLGQCNDSDLQTSALPCLVLLLPGIVDRRQTSFLPVTEEFNMSRINSDISTEIGSESHACSSSLGSMGDGRTMCLPVKEEDSERFSLPPNCSLQNESNPLDQSPIDDSEATTTRHGDRSLACSPVDDDPTPENRFLHSANAPLTDAWRLELPMTTNIDRRRSMNSDGAQEGDHLKTSDLALFDGRNGCSDSDPDPTDTPEREAGSPPSTLLIPNMRNLRDVTPPEVGLHPPNIGGAPSLTIPGLFSIQSLPPKAPTINLPWRIKYVPTCSSGVSSHDYLTDDTTADGCPDYEDEEDDEDDNSGGCDHGNVGHDNSIELPPGVSKKIHEYDKFDWEAEAYEGENIFSIDPLKIMLEPAVDGGDSNRNSDRAEEEPIPSVFIPLIGLHKDFIPSSSSSDTSGDETESVDSTASPQTYRHSDAAALQKFRSNASVVLKNIGSSLLETQRSAHRYPSGLRTIKSRDCTPHPNKQASRTSSSGCTTMQSYNVDESLSKGSSSSNSTTQSPFFPFSEGCPSLVYEDHKKTSPGEGDPNDRITETSNNKDKSNETGLPKFKSVEPWKKSNGPSDYMSTISTCSESASFPLSSAFSEKLSPVLASSDMSLSRASSNLSSSAPSPVNGEEWSTDPNFAEFMTPLTISRKRSSISHDAAKSFHEYVSSTSSPHSSCRKTTAESRDKKTIEGLYSEDDLNCYETPRSYEDELFIFHTPPPTYSAPNFPSDPSNVGQKPGPLYDSPEDDGRTSRFICMPEELRKKERRDLIPQTDGTSSSLLAVSNPKMKKFKCNSEYSDHSICSPIDTLSTVSCPARLLTRTVPASYPQSEELRV